MSFCMEPSNSASHCMDTDRSPATDNKSSAVSEDWVASREIPCNLPFSPRLEGGSLGKSSKDLLCTPRSRESNDEGFGVAGEQYPDPWFDEVQTLLAEHTSELNRLSAVFHTRFSALCQAKQAAGLHIQSPRSPRQILAMDTQADCGAQRTVSFSADAIEAHDTQQDPVHGAQERRSSNGTDAKPQAKPPLSTDFKLLKGWTKGSQRLTLRTSTSLKLRKQGTLGKMVQSTAFDMLSTLVIVIHSILMGIAADQSAQNPGHDNLQSYKVADIVFLVCYIIELLLRIAADRSDFFKSGWNTFDFVLVTSDSISQIYDLASSDDGSNALGSVATGRAFRVLRLLRAFRMLRMVRFFREFRMMVKCMFAGVKTALWVMLLLFMVIYIFAVYLTEQVARGLTNIDENHLDRESQDILRLRFGTLTDAWLSLFMAISNGISWQTFTDPLIVLDWSNGVMISAFIFLTLFAMLNIVTGVFVDCALTAAHTDEEEVVQDLMDDEASHLNKIRLLFEHANEDGDEELSLVELENQLSNPEIRLLFKSIGIGVHEVPGLFRMLDVDNSGTISLEEFIIGCMRVREGTSAIDLCTLMYENKRMMDRWNAFAADVDKQFQALHKHVSESTGL